MFAAIPVKIIGGFIAVGVVLFTGRSAKVGIAALLTALSMSRGYRKGEGPMSERWDFRITPQMAEEIPALERYQGRTYHFTMSEMRSLRNIADSIDPEKPRSVEVLTDFLDQFDSSRWS